MNTFKKGDKVICVDANIAARELTQGKIYTVLNNTNHYIRIKNDKGSKQYTYLSFRFVLSKSFIRKQKLDKLNTLSTIE